MSDLKEGALVDKDQSQATITVQLHPLVIMSSLLLFFYHFKIFI